jgi:hypothetical protein
MTGATRTIKTIAGVHSLAQLSKDEILIGEKDGFLEVIDINNFATKSS